ncbi:chitinase [Streptomyces avermitilis]|uniref:chitinase n=1 Tax=Streptomyces avermitilis TaxID=33903 RepID=UPI003679854D
MDRVPGTPPRRRTPGRTPRRTRPWAGLLAAVLGASVLSLTGAGPASAADVNNAKNGGYESGLGNWTCSASSGTTVSSPVHGGSAALKATPAGQDNAKCTQTVAVKPNSTYTLSAWVQGGYAYLGATGTGTTDVSTWTPDSTSWKQLTTTFTTGAATTSVTGTSATVSSLAASTSYSFQVTATNAAGESAKSTAVTGTTSASSGGGGGSVPKHAVTGYWQNFNNGAKVQKISDVQSPYDIIAVAFADATSTPGAVSFSLDSAGLGGYTVDQFKADIKAKQAAGKKVVISIGGQNGTVSVNDSASAANFANSVYSLMQTYGFDGVDIDLENGLNATYMSQALRSLSAKAGSSLVITMAPQTIDMQSTSNGYFQTALNIKDILTVVNMQYYNSGSMLGCDGKVYSQGSVDFLTALACIQLEGGLAPSQVGLGLPASTSGAGSGYVSPTVVNNALDCLTKATNCGSFKPSKTYPDLRGAMTWSTNWDASAGNAWSNGVGAHVHALP